MNRIVPESVKSIIVRIRAFVGVHRRLARLVLFVLAVLILFGLAMAVGHWQKLLPASNATTEATLSDNAALMADVPAKAAIRGNSLVVGVTDPLKFINPLFSTGDGEHDAVSLIFESLIQPGLDGQPTGQLASSWTFDADGHKLVFQMRNDHTFRDGRVVDSSDVVFTYQCLLAGSYDGPLQGRFTAIISVAAGASADIVIFSLADWVEEPDYDLFTVGLLKSDYYATKLDRVYEMREKAQLPEGSGPYELAEILGDKIVLLLRQGYGGDIKSISIRQIASADKYQMLKAGDLDIVRNKWDLRMQERAGSLTGYSLTRLDASPDSYFLVNPDLQPDNIIQLPSQRLAVLLTAAGKTLSDLQQRALQDLAGSQLKLYYFNGLDESVQFDNQVKAASLTEILERSGLKVEAVALDWPELAARATSGNYDIILLPATANSRLPEQTVILSDPVQPAASAWITGSKQEVFIVSNRLTQLSINPSGHPFAALAGTWTDRIENVRILNQDGTYWEEKVS
jgi:ABC-type transport system substrate-binding protein